MRDLMNAEYEEGSTKEAIVLAVWLKQVNGDGLPFKLVGENSGQNLITCISFTLDKQISAAMA